ncbi:canalicular multispecific organic anion transporter 2 [Venturia nashicola]|nr:canalicular multispecific organic anion transporter 2 [Venturia nashicola]
MQPLLIRRALDFIERQDGNSNIGYGLIGATVLVYSGLAILNGYYGHLLYRSITIVRGSLIDIIYHKSLAIELSAAQKAAPIGLVTADVERIDFTIERIHSLWASVIEIAIAIYLLEREMGWACFVPIFVALVCTLSTTFVSKMVPERQKRWNQAVQNRVALTSTMLSNMKTVKMMGYTNYIANTIQAARMSELAASKTFRKFMTVINSIVLIPKQLSAPFTFMVFVLAVQHGREAGGLTASRAFTSLTIIELITTPLGLALQAISSVTSSLACLDRIQAYLQSPNKVDQHRLPTSACSGKWKSDLIDLREKAMLECDAFGKEIETQSSITLRNATFAYKPAQDIVLSSISLTIPHGSVTMLVGPVGSGKSALVKAFLNELDLRSGQLDVRASRMAYCDSNPWIPSGSVRDCIVGMSESDVTWFDEVLHACALDEDILALAHGAETKIGSRGIALSEGQKQRLALARAIFSRAPLILLDDVFRSLDSSTELVIAQRLLSPEGLLRRCSLTAVLTTHSARYLSSATQIIVLEGGHVTQIGSFEHLSKQEGYVRSLSVQPQNIEIENFGLSEKDGSREKTKNAPVTRNSEKQAKRLVGTRDKSVYLFYLRPIGVSRCMILLFAVIALAVATRFQRVWVQWWTEDTSHQSMYIGVFFLLAVGACLSFSFFFCAPLSYFTTTDAGVILNRFSQDMAIINGMLPVNIFQAISIFMICLIQIAFIAYGSKYLSATIPLTFIVVWILSRFYLLTSQQLRLLDIELKAPIYTSLAETKEGLATIRAFGWQSSYKTIFQTRIDESKRATYLLFMIQRWLNFVLDLIIAGLATILMTLATQLRSSTNAAMFGVGLSSLIGFSMNVSQFIVCYTELENSLGAISRTKDCVDNIEAEDSSSSSYKKPPPDWPSQGAIEFRSVTASYNDIAKPALKNITFTAPAGHKICICGRTGSGKSTLISLLLRLLKSQEGQILIDSIDISTLPSLTIRQNINVIPQSPFFLPGSVRLNLHVDASSMPPDENLIGALRKVKLWDLISSRGGLDADLTSIALSHGQQQLFCLAAAILKKSTTKIVVIDEATSGVDEETEKMMDQLIKEEFQNCTVICIAHRLGMAREFDLVVVLGGGEVLEMGKPEELEERRGEFWRLLR